MRKQAFTLIELLVVITIIGILASVVLVSFPGAVKKAKESRVISSMGQIRTQAKILESNQGSYETVNCTIGSDGNCNCNDGSVQQLCNDIVENSSKDPVFHVDQDGGGYCVVSYLQGSEEYFCIDSSLNAKKYEESPAGSGNPCDDDCEASDSCACE